jgi:DNA polymerase I-like protein with 3'-5' exonuclease and polymerase domains
MKNTNKYIKNKRQLLELIDKCKATGYCSLDFETNGREFYHPLFLPTILGISFQPGISYILPLAHKESKFRKGGRWKKLLKLVGDELLENTEIVKVAWNVKFEMNVLSVYGITMRGRVFDGMLAKYLLKEERPNDLKSNVAMFIPEYAGYDLPGQPAGKKNTIAARERIIEFWSNVPLDELGKYCGLDCDLTLRLMFFFERLLIKNNFYKLFRNMMMMGARVIAESERKGIPIDEPFLESLVITYGDKIKELELKLSNHPIIKKFENSLIKERIKKAIIKVETEIEALEDEAAKAKKEGNTKVFNSKTKSIRTRNEKIDKYISRDLTSKSDLKLLLPVNFASPDQMKALFFTSKFGFRFKVVRYTVDKKTKKESENPSTDESVLEELKPMDPSGFIETLLEYRGTTKLYSTYIIGIKEKLSTDNYIHASFLLHGCVTGDTELLCKQGDIRIEDICPKDMGEINIENKGLFVLSHEGTWEHITHGINKGIQKTYKVTTDGGEIIKCTKEHKFLTIKGMKKLSYIIKHNIPLIMNDTSYLKDVGLKHTTQGKLADETQFKDIPGYPGYIVSDTGKLYSLKIKGAQGKLDYNNPHEMLPRIVKGYYRVGLRINDGRRHQKKISNLVWEAFKGIIPEGYEIDHKDHNKLNDHLSNLQLLTRSDNIKKNYINIRSSYTKGGINGNSKLDTITVGNILHDLSKDYNQKDIALTYNISPKQVSRIDKEEAWSNIYIAYIDKVKYIGKKPIFDISVNCKNSYVTLSNHINSNTVTGRLSSANPNLQNIPRDTTNSDIKKMFIPPKGKILLQLDYSQAELRVAAAQANEVTMLQWFRDGRDIHLSVACDKNKWDYDWAKAILDKEDKTDPMFTKIKTQRKYAKTINFGIIYGQTAKKLSLGMECSLEEAEDYLAGYKKQFPGIWKHIQRQQKYVAKHGFVYNLFGRKRRLNNIWSDDWGKVAEAQRQSVNAPIQGAASDYTLFSSILIWEKIQRGELPKDMNQCYTVHDSLGFFLDPADVHWVVPILEDICSNPETKEWFGFQIDSVKMQVDFEVSHENWGLLKTYHKEIDYTEIVDNYLKQAA